MADGAITSVVEESLGNIVLTQAYGREGAESVRLDREARAWFTASVRGARLSELYERLVEVIETVCVLAVIGLGAWEISAGRMTLGQLLAFAAFLGYLYPPVRDLGQLGLTVTTATAGAERHLPLARLRAQVALLPQETLILHDTIRENIGCGRPGASDEEIVGAARAADADAFIRALPDGYETRIDPHSARLSGGQLQRLAIARAMLRDAPVLVLDEPTTGLDALAARRVVTPLRRLMRGRTTLMITHDLNLAPDADRILVLDGGRIVETGRHEELLSRPGGAYARLHRSQNNAVVDTGELRLPLSADDGRPLFRDEVWLPGGVDGRR